MAEDSGRDIYELIEAHKRIRVEIQGLFPRVLSGFNDYINKKINPRLPSGFSLAEATEICFDPVDEVYEVRAGLITKSGLKTMVESMEAGVIAQILCKEYEEESPYVRIEYACIVENRAVES